MPTIPRRQRRPRPFDVETVRQSKNLMRHLTHGAPFMPGKGFQTLEQFQAAWDALRDELLPKYIEEHPGKRPAAWWIVDHQAERPIINAHLFHDDTEQRERNRPERFGFLHTSIYAPVDGELRPFQMPEVEYLEMYGLLEFDELERIEQ